jgi:ABC-type methionine transport system ATPase subunit
MIRCARVAGIHDEIMAMTMTYNSLIGDMGSSLSGGQKQRVLLARVLYHQPRILFLDEGTAHLDLDLERRINEALKNLEMTRISVAHRPPDGVDRIVQLAKTVECENGWLGETAEVCRTKERAAILSVLIDSNEPISPLAIAAETGMPRNNVDQLLFKMAKAGDVRKAGRGHYLHPSKQTAHVGDKKIRNGPSDQMSDSS